MSLIFVSLGVLLCIVVSTFFIGVFCLSLGFRRLLKPLEGPIHQKSTEKLLIAGCLICGLLFPVFVVFVPIFFPVPNLVQNTLIFGIGGCLFCWGTLNIRAHLLYKKAKKTYSVWIALLGGIILAFGFPLAILTQFPLPSWFSHILVGIDVIVCIGYLWLLNYWDNKRNKDFHDIEG